MLHESPLRVGYQKSFGEQRGRWSAASEIVNILQKLNFLLENCSEWLVVVILWKRRVLIFAAFLTL